MATAPRTRPSQRGRNSSRRRSSQHATSFSPTPLDQRRYYDFKAGMSPAEIAARDNITLPTVEKSLTRMRSHANQFSQESAEIATRQLYLERLPDANHVFAEALAATKTVARIELVKEFNTLTEREEYIERTVHDIVPDHSTRLKATDALQKLLAGVQPRQPMVAVDARSQTNIGLLGQGTGQQPAGALSSESIIRQLRLERGLAVGDITAEEEAAPVPVEVDTELADDLEDDDDDDEDSADDDAVDDSSDNLAEDDDDDEED